MKTLHSPSQAWATPLAHRVQRVKVSMKAKNVGSSPILTRLTCVHNTSHEKNEDSPTVNLKRQ